VGRLFLKGEATMFDLRNAPSSLGKFIKEHSLEFVHYPFFLPPNFPYQFGYFLNVAPTHAWAFAMWSKDGDWEILTAPTASNALEETSKMFKAIHGLE